MRKYTFKRAIAYVIDLFIIYLFVMLLSSVKFLNPNIAEYNELQKEYNIVYNDYLTAISSGASGLEEMDNQILNMSYDLSVLGAPISFINIVIAVVYFVIFKYFNKGQTVGMQIFKLKLVSDGNKKLSFLQNLISSVLIYSILTSFSSYIFLVFFTKNIYIAASTIIVLIDSLIILITLLCMMFREDGKGLHDIITNTNVISTKENKTVKEAKTNEKKKGE